MILINSITRQFNVPGSDLVFGVVADSDAERKFFQCPRYVGYDLDLAACFIRINYRNANGKEDFYLVDDVVINGDNITFSWLLSPKVTEYRGQVKFVLCAVGPDLKLKWHTTQGTGQVLDGLEPDNSHVESQTADVVAQLVSMVEVQTSAVEKAGAEQVAYVRSAAETSRTAAVNEIETAGKNTRDSIPADYTALSAAVRKTAPGIVCSVEGEVITLSDASDNYLRGLRVFAKTTQSRAPTTDDPVGLISSVYDGSISIYVDGLQRQEVTISAPNGMRGIRVSSGGNYTDANGQQWISDEIDFARGVFVQRIYRKVFTGEEDFVKNGQPGNYYLWKEILAAPNDGNLLTGALCTRLVEKVPDRLWDTVGDGFAISTATPFCVHLRIESISTVDALKAKLREWANSKNPLSMAFKLATPIETPLSETALAAYRALHTNKPNTTILNDSGAYMSVDYTADTKLYIDNKIKEALL